MSILIFYPITLSDPIHYPIYCSSNMASSGKSLYTQARKIGSSTFILSVIDIEPAGVLVKAYNAELSQSWTLSVQENEMERAKILRTEKGLKRLIESIELGVDNTDAGSMYIYSNLVGVQHYKKTLNSSNLRQFLSEMKSGENLNAEEKLMETLTKALAALCAEKPTKTNAIRWLGNYLLENQPGAPVVSDL